MTRIAIMILFGISLSSCLKDDQLKLQDHGFEPKALADGLGVSTPEAESVNRQQLKQAFDLFYSEQELPRAKGLVIMRNGSIVAEAYCQDTDDISKIDNVQSCTKSITSLLIGIAIRDGLIKSVQDPVYDYLPEHFDGNISKRKISVRNCLTLQAGLEYTGTKESERMVNHKGSSITYVLNKSMVADTGSVFLYSDFPPQLLTGILNKVTSSGILVYAGNKLFTPLGIKKYKWEATDDGIPIGAFSLFITTRDLARIGQLCIQNGNWNGVSLIDPAWIKSISVKQAKNVDYGYGFYTDQNTGTYTMQGNGGQFVYINPSKSLVIAYTADPYTDAELWGDRNKLINLIRNACK